MIPLEFAGVEQTLTLWLVAMIRPGAAFIVAPIFNAPSIPLQLRLVLALAVGIPAIATGHIVVAAGDLLSLSGLLLVLGEAMVGAMIGFAVQVGFAAAAVAGEIISNAIGLGFAAMMDPMGGQQSPMIGQFLTILATFLFLAIDGHLVLSGVIARSYTAMPTGGAWFALLDYQRMAGMGTMLFAAAVTIALPVGFAVILVQLVMGVLTRSAPALNIFAVGLPATLIAGIVLMAMAMPVMSDAIIAALTSGLEQAARIGGG